MAREVRLFNDNWFFTKTMIDPAAPPFDKMEPVTLPHTWNAQDGQDGGSDFYRGLCWYARKLDYTPSAQELWIEFGAVSQTAAVYINGTPISTHEGGFSAFRAQLTPHLKAGENLIAVSADNGENQRTYPQFADFTFFGGIYRDVLLIQVAKTHFALRQDGAPPLTVTPILQPDGSAVVTVQAQIAAAEDVSCRFALQDAEGQEVASLTSDGQTAEFTLPRPHLWQGVVDPYLYCATAQLLSGQGSMIDEVSIHFGIRSYTVDPQKGFFLNGVLTPLRGVSRHQCREDKGWAISRDDELQDMELIAEMGANTIRLAHYQHSQNFYDLCDQFGMVVWAEIPFISQFMDNPDARENTLSQMRDLVEQCHNHPSICFWGISNEITMGGDDEPALLDNQRALNDLCHILDPTRLTTIAHLSMVDEDSPQHRLTDVMAYNHYFGWYVGDAADNAPWFDAFHAAHPDLAVGLSEYGAEGNINLHSETPEPRDYSEEYHALYHEEMLHMLEERPWIWGSYVWNMFEFASDMRDEGQVAGRNNKGLVNFSRTVKKDAYYLHKAFWTTAPFAHLCGRRFAERCGEATAVKVYAAGADEVALMLNGSEVARVQGARIFRFDNVRLAMGSNRLCAIGYAAGSEVCRDEIDLTRTETPNPAYRLPEPSGDSVANWFDASYTTSSPVFDPAYFSVKDNLGDVMRHPEGEALLMNLLDSMMSGDKAGGMKISKGMLKMLGRMSFEQIFQMAGKRLPPDALYIVNAQLQTLKK